jgi:hypothetical protein
MPRLLRELVAGAVAVEPDLDLVGELPDPADLAALVEGDVPDVVIVGEDAEIDALAAALFRRCPSVRVLEVVADGRAANLYRLRPTREFIGNLSPDSLVAAVRGRA